jgi:hypothetical protein
MDKQLKKTIEILLYNGGYQIRIYTMFATQEKRKYDETPYEWNSSTRLKFIVGLAFIGIVVALFLGQLGNPWSIKETPDADIREKIKTLENQADEVPEFISVEFASLPETPICAAVDMQVLADYNPKDLIEWSEISFNGRRLPSEDVSITIQDVEGYWGPYSESRLLETRSALKMCFKRGLLPNGGHDQTHLLRISVHDTFVHEVLAYEWAFHSCLCR